MGYNILVTAVGGDIDQSIARILRYFEQVTSIVGADELKPVVIYTHHGGDLNIDHQTTRRAVLTAARPIKGCPVTQIYTFDVPSSTDWAFQPFEPLFRPNVFVDIKETLEIKLRATQLYESEVQAFPHPRSAEALIAHARYWGSMAELEAAEAFQLVRSIRWARE